MAVLTEEIQILVLLQMFMGTLLFWDLKITSNKYILIRYEELTVDLSRPTTCVQNIVSLSLPLSHLLVC
jgi:hypothetical protein